MFGNKNSNRQLVLNELQRAFDKKVAATDAIDNKLQNILNFSSVIIAVFTAITTSTLLSKVGIFYWLGFIAVLALYVYVYSYVKNGLGVAKFIAPISKDFNELETLCINVGESESLDIIIKAHLSSMYSTDEIIEKKAVLLDKAANLMFWIVILLSMAIFLGLLFPSLTLLNILQPFIKIFTDIFVIG